MEIQLSTKPEKSWEIPERPWTEFINNFRFDENTNFTEMTIANLSSSLMMLHNLKVSLGQYEPEAKRYLDIAKINLENKERKFNEIKSQDLYLLEKNAPESAKKNKEIYSGYVLDLKRSEYAEIESEIKRLKSKVVEAQRDVNEIYRQLRLANDHMEIGKAVMYSLKEELRNLNTQGTYA